MPIFDIQPMTFTLDKMNKNSEIRAIEDALNRIEYHFKQFLDYQNKSKTASVKKNRERALKNMSTSASFLRQELTGPIISEIIASGNIYQFEDFYTHVDSDVPDYIESIKKVLDGLKSSDKED